MLFKCQGITLTRDLLDDCFKKNGKISELVMDAFGKLLNDYCGSSPDDAKHSYIVPSIYMVKSFKHSNFMLDQLPVCTK